MTENDSSKQASRALELAQQRLRALHEVMVAITSATTLSEAAPRVLSAVAHELGVAAANFWVVNRDANRLEVLSTYGLPEEQTAPSEWARSFAPGEGILGRVWQSRALVFSNDVTRDKDFVRSSAASNARLHGAFWVPLMADNDLAGILEGFYAEPLTPDPELIAALSTLGGQIGQCVARLQAEAAYRRDRARFSFLSKAAVELSSSLDYDQTLKNAAQLAVPALADWCSIELVDEQGRLVPLAVLHVDPAKVELARRMRERYPPPNDAPYGAPHVARTGQPELYPEITPELLAKSAQTEEHLRLALTLNLRSAMIVPITARGQVRGAISFVAERAQRYDAEDLAMAEELGRRAGTAIDNAELYREAQRAIRAREEFISMAAHELKTPLTTLALQVQTLAVALERGAAASVDKLAPKLEAITRQVNRMRRHLTVLLDVSRIDSGRLELELEQVDLVQIVREAVERTEVEAKQAGCELSLDAPSSVVGAWDAMRLEQAIANLLSNAYKYGAGQPIGVVVRAEGGHATLSVRDRGPGIGSEDHARIFQRYERAVSSKNFAGFGLGLWVARRLVEAHAGTLELESSVGSGSLFIIRLPLKAAALLADWDAVK